MNSPKLIYTGIFIIAASFIIPSLFFLRKFRGYFDEIQSENSGIGSFAFALDALVIWALFILGGILLGFALIILGKRKQSG